jgi:hypothetical protein
LWRGNDDGNQYFEGFRKDVNLEQNILVLNNKSMATETDRKKRK